MSSLYLFDTNIISELMRRPDGPAAARYRDRVLHSGSVQFAISVIVHFELMFGLQQVRSPRLQRNFDRQMALLNILPLEAGVSRHYAQLRHSLERQGKPIGYNDTLIAAHALALDATLVSADAEFTRVPGLTVENWLS